MNIIIPIGGMGKRFADEKYLLPKPLIKAHGKPIIFHLLDNLKIKENDILIIVYREEFNNFNFQQLLRKNYPEILFRFKEVSFNTRGASETVLLGLSCLDENEIEDTAIIIDSDVFFEDDILDIARKSLKNLIFYFKDNEETPLYSYVRIDREEVLDIQEKVKISNNACAGAYCFSSSKILQNLIKEVIQKDEKIKGEFYISNLYKKLIYKNIKIDAVEITNYTCLGTPSQLFAFASNFNKPHYTLRICFDLDNTLVTYPMVNNDYASVLPIEKNIEKLRNYKKMGHYIIIYTARRMKTHNGNINNVISDIGEITLNTLHKFQIPYDEIYFGKPYADFYIDDLAINSFCDIDKEIGIYNTHTKPRLCNNVECYGCKCNDSCCKYGADFDKKSYDLIKKHKILVEDRINININDCFDNVFSGDMEFIGGNSIRSLVGADGYCVFHNKNGKGCILYEIVNNNKHISKILIPSICRLFPLSWENVKLIVYTEQRDSIIPIDCNCLDINNKTTKNILETQKNELIDIIEIQR